MPLAVIPSLVRTRTAPPREDDPPASTIEDPPIDVPPSPDFVRRLPPAAV